LPDFAADARAGRLRTDSLVTASTNPRASTPSPASWPPTTEAPCESAEVFATGVVLPFWLAGVPAEGSVLGVSVGNRPAALPPGRSVALGRNGKNGRLPTESGVVPSRGGPTTGAGTTAPGGGAVTFTVELTFGFFGKFAALATTVSRTDVTLVAVTGTATCACSSRLADVTSTAPRSHSAVPSWLPQPTLYLGFRLAGAAARLMVAWGTLPPCVHAFTIHCAACPRAMLVCVGCIATQRLTCEVVDAAVMSAVSVPVDVAELALGLALPDPESDVLGADDWSVVAGVGEAESVGLGVLVSVGLGEVGLGVGLGVSLGVVLLGVGVGLVGVGVGVGLVGVGVGVGLGVGSCSGSHCWTITLVKRAVTAGLAAVVRGGHDGAADAVAASPRDMATRAPPVTKPAATGRMCAKRMIMPLPALLVATAERLFSMEWLHQA
jgi:hypothetical protein